MTISVTGLLSAGGPQHLPSDHSPSAYSAVSLRSGGGGSAAARPGRAAQKTRETLSPKGAVFVRRS